MSSDLENFNTGGLNKMSGKQVSQATFDAIVREAISDFGLPPPEAVADAREQLAKVGVTDFSNLVNPTSSDSTHLLSKCMSISSMLQTALGGSDSDQVIAALINITELNEKAAAVAGGSGAIEAVMKVLASIADDEAPLDPKLAILTCRAIAKLCACNEANRMRFIQHRYPSGVKSLTYLLQALSRDGERDAKTVDAVFTAVASIQRRCESVKRQFAAGGTPDAVLTLLLWSATQVCKEEAKADLFRNGSLVVRQWMAMDDVSATVAETFVRARLLSGAKVVTESGLRPLEEAKTLTCVLEEVIAMGQHASKEVRNELLRESLLMAKVFAVSDEICKEIARLGFPSLSICMLDEKRDDEKFVYACLGMLRSLAGRDDCKGGIFEGIGVVKLAVECHVKTNERIAEVFCALIAGLCLRRPDIGRLIVLNGSISLVLDAMEDHKDSAKVLKSGCLAIRNAASRDEKSRLILVSDRRAEIAVRRAWKMFPNLCSDAAYSALEELDVLVENEMRRDNRYSMPAGFYQRPISRKGR